MPTKHQVEAAVEVARGLLGSITPTDSPTAKVMGLLRRFSTIEFDVPDFTDADGYLFQYGKVNWFSEPTFVLSLVRQFEVVNSSRCHEYYIQVQFELRYPLDDHLESVGSHSEWWFPGGKTSFDGWLDSVKHAPIMSLLAQKTPREFEIWQDQV